MKEISNVATCKWCGSNIVFTKEFNLELGDCVPTKVENLDGSPHSCKRAKCKVYTKEEIIEFEKQRKGSNQNG